METRISAVDVSRVGVIRAASRPDDILDELHIALDAHSADAEKLRQAAEKLRSSNIPVAFPTETVYGLGADATRSDAVKGIYKAKQRPSDNPLIVHFASLAQLRALLAACDASEAAEDPIPAIYHPLVSRFWPGPLTIILPTPSHSLLAPEVTAGLTTFGARLPRHPLALALIQLAGVPIAAPSANASTKPSPTAAEHVEYDLNGRIETIIDGGPCSVGVESTVVDGLSQPPLILRPGGISLEQIRACPGWEAVQIGYKNTSELGTQPRAPGMKYRHYSPKATVILYEAGRPVPTITDLRAQASQSGTIGIVRTRNWAIQSDSPSTPLLTLQNGTVAVDRQSTEHVKPGFAGMLSELHSTHSSSAVVAQHETDGMKILDMFIGPDTASIARSIFSALRALDQESVDAIFVEGMDDEEGSTAAAIMNRLRKAAEIHV